MKKKNNKHKKQGNRAKVNPDKDFCLSKDKFFESYLPLCKERGIEPKYIMQFIVLLPFHIPITQDNEVNMGLTNGDSSLFSFVEVTRNRDFTTALSGIKPIKLPIKRTKVIMTYIFGRDIEFPPNDDFIRDVFENLLDLLNTFLLSYIIFKKDSEVYQVTREMLDIGFMQRFLKISDWENAVFGLFINHQNIPNDKEPLTYDEYSKMVIYANIINLRLNPFVLSEELILNAERNIIMGFFKESVLHAQSSVETFIGALLQKLLEVEGKTEQEIQSIKDDVSFMRVVKKELPERLGGNWNPDLKEFDVGKWYMNTYQLRNRIAHGGYRPTYYEAVDALESARNFVKYIIGLIHSNKKKYPGIAEYVYCEESCDS